MDRQPEQLPSPDTKEQLGLVTRDSMPTVSPSGTPRHPRDPWKGPQIDRSIHIPNFIPARYRIWGLIAAILLLVWGGYGVYVNDLLIPGKRGGGHLRDEPALLMFAALFCGALQLVSRVVDHYDRRNNEYKYQKFVRITDGATLVFLLLAFVGQFLKNALRWFG